MNDLELLLPGGGLTPFEIPLYEQVRIAFLLKFRNQHTATGYARSLRQWFDWCQTNGIDPLQATRVHIEFWKRVLEAGGNKPTTIAAKINALAGYYRYAVIDEVIIKDPMLHVERPQIPRESSTNGVNRFEMAACLAEAEKDGPRTHALICLLGLNGMRIGEVLGIDIEDVSKKGPYPVVNITRKGGKTSTQPLGYRASYAITVLSQDRDSGPLLIATDGARLSRQAAGRIVKRIAARAGIDKRISPHSFRHGFVTIARNAGMTSRDILSATGHKDERMLTYYDREKDSLARSAVHGVEAHVAGVM